MSMYDADFLQTRIDAAKALILTLETAIDALSTDSVEQYTLDTGQSRQVVTKRDVVRLNAMLDSVMNRLATLEARRNGSGSRHGRLVF